MIFGGKDFGRSVGLEGKAFINGISALIKDIPEKSFDPPPY